MAEEQSKFSGILGTLKQPAKDQQPTTPPPQPRGTESVRGRGRPPGKRSDPDYQPTTVLLRKHTKRTAARLLEDINAAHDLSDLIEQLLTEWIQQHA